MKTEILQASERLVAGALDGLYQGIIVTVLVALALRCLGRTNAATRHAIWFCALFLVVALMATHCLREFGAFAITAPIASREEPDSSDSLSRPAPLLEASQDGIGESSAEESNASMDADYLRDTETLREALLLQTFAIANDAELSVTEPLPLTVRTEEESETPTEASTAQESEPKPAGFFQRLKALKAFSPASWKLTFVPNVTPYVSLVLLGLWLPVAAVRILMLSIRLFEIRRMKRGSIRPGPELSALYHGVCGGLASRRKAALRQSTELRSPVLLGFFHPVILLPPEQSPEEAEPVLRHELAHVSRYDDWVNLVQKSVQSVLFFHPAVWWISRQLTLEREIACDDAVLQQSRKPKAYALVLANLAGRVQGFPPVLAPGVSNNKTQLQQRIDMILDTKRNTSPNLAKFRLGLVTSAAAIVAVAAIYAAPRVVFAQSETTPPVTPVAPAPPDAPSALPAPSGGAFGGNAIVTFAPSATLEAGEAVKECTPAPGAVGAGPKVKSTTLFALPQPPLTPSPAIIGTPAPVARVAPSVPFAVATPVAPAPPMIASVQVDEPRIARQPRPARARRADGDDASVEERLARLEKMVESLVAQQNGKPGQDPFKYRQLGQPGQQELERKLAEMAKKQAEMGRLWAIDPKQLEKMQQDAERNAARASEEAKRATRETLRALEELKKSSADAKAGKRKMKDGPQMQIEALRRQMESLERERERLGRQIEKLQREQEQLDESDDEDSNSDAEPKKPEPKDAPKAGN
jgi:beta-lactamase regulating signal transducer with metallopeptidase domain